MTAGSETAARKRTTATNDAKRQLTCFVVTGFGEKTDYSTGRVLNLDKTYEQLVRPACDRVNVNCFRAIDANLTGSIDAIMYRWIYDADIVIADLSTLNANVFYELGVRHAQRPNTTLIIAESVLMERIPFDLSSFVIHEYEHGGEDINAREQERFVEHLAEVLENIIAAERRRQAATPQVHRESDSPVFKFMIGMTPPAYQAESYLEPPAYIPPALRADAAVSEGESLASVIDAAEAAKKNNDLSEAMRLFARAIELQTDGEAHRKPDVFLAQRLALVTYKAGEQPDANGNVDRDAAIAALYEAETILAKYCAPKISNDPETLGLSGAINKRLFELTDDLTYLERAIGFYERGFYVKRDYYSGINVAYMYTQRANLLADSFGAIVSYGHANMIRQNVIEICEALIDDEVDFALRGDQQWVYMTLAEAYQGLGRNADEERLWRKIDSIATDFGRKSYLGQKAKLQAAIDEFERQVRPADLGAKTGTGGSVSPSPAAEPVAQTETTQQVSPAVSPGARPSPIDAGAAQRQTDPAARAQVHDRAAVSGATKASVVPMGEADYIEQRLDDQLNWFEKKSAAAQRWYKRLRLIEIVAAASIPLLAVYDGKFDEKFSYTTLAMAAIGVVVAVLAGTIGLYRFQENWTEYRAAAESLKQEKYLYLTRAAPYNGDQPFETLVRRTEALLKSEYAGWAQAMRE